MIQPLVRGWTLLLALSVFLAAASAGAQGPQQAPRSAKRPKSPSKGAARMLEPVVEPKATDILKAVSSRLAAAHTMKFTAVVFYENPSLIGPPLVYTTKSEVILERPDKLRVITSADGPPSEFYYDGKMMMAFAPTENLVAVADAPPTIDAALKAAYDSAAIYFPFSDLVVADPYKDISDDLKFAFYIGQSRAVGGTTTDMVAYGNGSVFVQAWIGADDKLPRMVRAIYRDDSARLRHQMELSDWLLDLAVPADTFGSTNAASATKIQFARPDPKLPPSSKPPAKGKKAAKSQ